MSNENNTKVHRLMNGTGVMKMAYDLAFEIGKQEDQVLNTILSYIVSSRPAWATKDPVTKQK